MQEPAPHRPIERGLAGPGLLAHVLVAKYADHLPLYRQSEIYAREGVELDRSTLADWVGGASRTLEPLVDAIRRYVLDATKLHGDDIRFRCWLRETAKRKPVVCGLTCVMIGRRAAPKRQRFGLPTRPDRKSEHPGQSPGEFRGTLASRCVFAGFNRLYEHGGIVEAACWAHVRRKFHDLYEAHASPIAKEALERIAALYGIEKEIRGRPPDERQADSPTAEHDHYWILEGVVARHA